MGVWSSFLKEFLENIQKSRLGVKIVEKGHDLRLFQA